MTAVHSSGKLVAILGGSGLARFEGLEVLRREVIRTPFGEPSGALTFGRLPADSGWQEVVFLPRHGYGHTIPPHDINYRANLWALNEVGARAVFAVASVGGIRDDLLPGSLVLPDQIIDYTHGRLSTFFDSAELPVTHIDFTLPYDCTLRAALLDGARRAGIGLVDGGVYACTPGPRLETAAEIERLARDGAHMVGMTGMPEAALARELDLPYAALAVVVNAAAGRGASRLAISVTDIARIQDQAMGLVRAILAQTVPRAVSALDQVRAVQGVRVSLQPAGDPVKGNPS
jgi:5'-methylthioinosine phosphorylase